MREMRLREIRSPENTPHPHHGVCVQFAVVQELMFDFPFPFERGCEVDCFLKGFDGHIAALDSVKLGL